MSKRLGDGTTRITINLPDGVATRLHRYLEAFACAEALRRRRAWSGRGGPDPDRPQARTSLLLAAGGRRSQAAARPRRRRDHLDRDGLHRRSAQGPRHRRPRSRGEAHRRRGTPARVHRPDHPRSTRREVRGPRPGPRLTLLQTRAAQGDDHPRPRVPRRGMPIPAAWCEAHHWGRPWAKGGRTDLKDGVLLCNWHHHRAHDTIYDSSRMPNGDVRIQPPDITARDVGDRTQVSRWEVRRRQPAASLTTRSSKLLARRQVVDDADHLAAREHAGIGVSPLRALP